MHSRSTASEDHSSEEPHADDASRCEVEVIEDQLEEDDAIATSPLVNVIVKEEEQEQPLCVEGLDPDVSSCEECPLPEPSPEIRITVKDEPEELADNSTEEDSGHVVFVEETGPTSPQKNKTSYCCGLC
ncbi:hypothetical protein CRUP_008749, partial [Coryphaenoides rupestris]